MKLSGKKYFVACGQQDRSIGAPFLKRASPYAKHRRLPAWAADAYRKGWEDQEGWLKPEIPKKLATAFIKI